jgi:HSP20 family molecular chaperone IbpA
MSFMDSRYDCVATKRSSHRGFTPRLAVFVFERSEKKESTGRSEFSYGLFVRSVSLPAPANEDDIKATYDKGLLTVSVPVPEAAPGGKHIAVQAAS